MTPSATRSTGKEALRVDPGQPRRRCSLASPNPMHEAPDCCFERVQIFGREYVAARLSDPIGCADFAACDRESTGQRFTNRQGKGLVMTRLDQEVDVSICISEPRVYQFRLYMSQPQDSGRLPARGSPTTGNDCR
jgi:hypothetical protein